MTDSKISDLTEDTAPDPVSDFLETSDTSAGPGSKKVKPSNLLGPAQNAQTGTTYTYVLTDAFKTVTLSNASAIAVTIPTNASVAFPIGTTIRNFRLGAGLPTISPAGGVTLHLPTGIRPNRLMGAIATKSTDQTTADYTAGVAVTWNTDVYDTDAFHDTGSLTSRMTIPSGLGIKKIRLSANIQASLMTADLWHVVFLLKAGAAFDGYAESQSETGATGHGVNVCTNPVSVADTNYFEAWYRNETDTSITIVAANSNFGITVEEIDPVGSITYQYGWVTIEKIGTDEWIIYGPALG